MQRPRHVSPAPLRTALLRAASLCLPVILCGATGPAIVDDGASFPPELAGWQRTFTGPRAGAPAGVRALAQTPDGIVWIGASDGLYRYDGREFARLAPSSRMPTQADTISALLATREGDLWIGHDYGGLSLVRAGRHRAVTGLRMSSVMALPANRNGAAWAIGSDSRQVYLARLVDRRWVAWTELKADLFYGSAVDAKGTLWLIVGNRLIAVSARDRTARVVAQGLRGSSLVSGADGRAWLVGKRDLTELGGAGRPGRITGFTRRGDAPIRFEDARHFWMIQGDNVLERYAVRDGDRATRTGRWQSGHALTASVQPLSSLPSMIDREGALWIGSNQGLERFSRSAFVPVLAGANNSVQNRSPAFAAADGRGVVWAWRQDRLFRQAGGGSLGPWPGSRPGGTAPCAARAGGVWVFDGRDRFDRLGGPSAASRSLGTGGAKVAETLGFNNCLEDERGRLWVGTDRGLALVGTKATGLVPLGEDSGFSIGTYAPWREGWVLGYVGNGNLWLTDGKHARIVWRHADNSLGFIEVQYRSGDSVLLGGDRGLGRFDGRSLRVILNSRFAWAGFVAGIVQTPGGETWLQTSSGIVRIRTKDLDRAFADPGYRPDVRIFRAADGVPGPPTYANMSGLALDRGGRVWASTSNGIAVLDPAKAPPDGPPPPVLVTRIEADERVYPVGSRLRLPAGTTRLRVQLSVIDFDDPLATRLSYRLQGMDAGWVDAGSQRMATFTNLAPGRYRLEVIGANSHGVWNRDGTSIEIDVAAHFWQTRWFAVAVGLAVLAAIWLGMRWRIAQVTQRLRSQAAERANERERIARDLHDTLLQGVQGLVLRIQSIAGRMPEPDLNRQALEKSLDRADALIAEGKLRVHNMHLDDALEDLPTLLRQAMAEMPFPVDVDRSIVVTGSPVSLDPVVAREVREIVSEALFNAARHARAGAVVIRVSFGSRMLEVRVADDGVGIAGDRKESAGYGLTAMGKRAQGIGGSLSIETGTGQGTGITVRVPARRAYRFRPGMLSRWFRS